MLKYSFSQYRKPITAYDIHQMPGYESILDVTRVSASISKNVFKNEFILKRLPVVIEGAVRTWPAFKLWSNPTYINKLAGEEMVSITNGLILDYFLQCVSERRLFRCQTNPIAKNWFTIATLSHYITMMTSEYDSSMTRYMRNQLLPLALRKDVGKLPFISSSPLDVSWFYGRNSYTDSHEHMGNDAVMCQVSGAKEVILHKPDCRSDAALYPNLALRNWSPVRFFDVDLTKFPQFLQGQPYRAVVAPGDALYIPDPWWHAVVSLDTSSLEITVPAWFDPPIINPSIPASKRLLSLPTNYFKIKKRGVYVPSSYLGVLGSYITRPENL